MVTNLPPYKARETLIVLSGLGSQMWIVILGRAISGIGGAGTMTISSVIITGTLINQTARIPLEA